MYTPVNACSLRGGVVLLGAAIRILRGIGFGNYSTHILRRVVASDTNPYSYLSRPFPATPAPYYAEVTASAAVNRHAARLADSQPRPACIPSGSHRDRSFRRHHRREGRCTRAHVRQAAWHDYRTPKRHQLIAGERTPKQEPLTHRHPQRSQ